MSYHNHDEKIIEALKKQTATDKALKLKETPLPNTSNGQGNEACEPISSPSFKSSAELKRIQELESEVAYLKKHIEGLETASFINKHIEPK